MECFWKSVRTFTYAPFISFYTFCLASVPSTLEISQFEAGSGHCWKPLMSGSGSVYKLGLRLQFLTSFVAIGYVVWGWFEFLGEKGTTGITSSHQERCDVSVVSGMEPKSMDDMLTPLESKGPVMGPSIHGIIYDNL